MVKTMSPQWTTADTGNCLALFSLWRALELYNRIYHDCIRHPKEQPQLLAKIFSFWHCWKPSISNRSWLKVLLYICSKVNKYTKNFASQCHWNHRSTEVQLTDVLVVRESLPWAFHKSCQFSWLVHIPNGRTISPSICTMFMAFGWGSFQIWKDL